MSEEDKRKDLPLERDDEFSPENMPEKEDTEENNEEPDFSGDESFEEGLESESDDGEQEQEKSNVKAFDPKQMIKQLIRRDELPNIILYKDRSLKSEDYCYLSKYTGKVKTTSHANLQTKVFEELLSFDWFKEEPIALVKGGENKYDLIKESINYVDDTVFNPTLPFGIVRDKTDQAFKYFNFYKMTDLKKRLLEEIKTDNDLTESVNGLWNKLHTHYPYTLTLLKNVCGGENVSEKELEKHIKWLLNWMARATRPEDGKCTTAPVFRGEQGSGKTALAETFFRPLFVNYLVFDSGKLQRDFNEDIDKAEFIMGEEIEISDKHAANTYAKLKQYITNEYADMNVKNLSARNVRIWFNMMFAQNPVKPMKFELGDRRYTVFETSDKKLAVVVEELYGITDIEDEFFKVIREKERDGFLKDLLNLDYNKSQTEKVLMTEAKMKLTKITNTSETMLAEYISKGEFDKLYEEGYITPLDAATPKEAMDIARFFVQANAGFLNDKSRKVFTYFALLHKKNANKKLTTFDEITDKEATDMLKQNFKRAENCRKQVNGKRTRLTLLDKNSFNDEAFKRANEILKSETETVKEFFRLINIEYSTDDEFRELCEEIMGDRFNYQ